MAKKITYTIWMTFERFFDINYQRLRELFVQDELQEKAEDLADRKKIFIVDGKKVSKKYWIAVKRDELEAKETIPINWAFRKYAVNYYLDIRG